MTAEPITTIVHGLTSIAVSPRLSKRTNAARVAASCNPYMRPAPVDSSTDSITNPCRRAIATSTATTATTVPSASSITAWLVSGAGELCGLPTAMNTARAADSSRAPTTSCQRMRMRFSAAAKTSANSRLAESNGSTAATVAMPRA